MGLETQCHEIAHIPGRNNKIADCVSRNPFEKELEEDNDDLIENPTFMLQYV